MSVYQRVKQHVHTVATNATVHSGLERDRRHGMWLCLVNLHLGKRIIAQRAVLYSIALYANARVGHATDVARVAWNAIAFVALIGMVRVRDALKPAEALAVALAARYLGEDTSPSKSTSSKGIYPGLSVKVTS